MPIQQVVLAAEEKMEEHLRNQKMSELVRKLNIQV